MTLEEAKAKAGDKMDQVFVSRLLDFEDALRRHGATETEIDAEIARQKTEYATFRENALSELEAWLRRGGNGVN
jgi:hypothetical protein